MSRQIDLMVRMTAPDEANPAEMAHDLYEFLVNDLVDDSEYIVHEVVVMA